MKKNYFILSFLIVAFVLTTSPRGVSAHESRTYEIDRARYQFVVGSLNEPIAVDDKTGVHLMVTGLGSEKGGAEEDHHAATGAVEGLDKSVKVEISAGGKKKVMDLSPVYGEAGAYRANFIPTVQTTYTYRFFGTLKEVPIDVSFTCNPAGHPVSAEEANPVKLSDGVTQLTKKGAFGCPVAKAGLGFPEEVMSEYELMSAVDTALIKASNEIDSSRSLAIVGIILGLLGIAMGFMKNKKSV